MSSPSSNMRSLDRAFDILAVLQDAKLPLRLSELARTSGLHIATAQRIVNVLVQRGYVARTGDTYTAGPAALAAAHAFLVTNPLSVLAQTTLQQLAAATRYTASMYVRVENSRVLITRVESENPLSYVLPVGERLPLHLGGAGKVMLAEMTDDAVIATLPSPTGITLATGESVATAELLAELVDIRRAGHAVSVSERSYGIASVAAPVRAPDGTLAAVVGITGPSDATWESQLPRLITEVRRAATSLGSRTPISG